MSSAAQRLENDTRVQRIVHLCAGDNVEAQEYLFTFSRMCRLIDDVVDDDHPITDDAKRDAFTSCWFTLPTNNFRQANPGVVAMELVAYNAWLDSDEIRSTDKEYGGFLSAMMVEMFPLVAFLVGGWQHMRSVSRQIREEISGSLFRQEEF